jgi:hypothetical protein
MSTETIAFGNTTEGGLGISNFIFGCMDNDTASFGTVDGLAGFSRKKNSLPSQLNKFTSSNVFLYCLVRSSLEQIRLPLCCLERPTPTDYGWRILPF